MTDAPKFKPSAQSDRATRQRAAVRRSQTNQGKRSAKGDAGEDRVCEGGGEVMSINDLSPPALKAALRGGMEGWGWHGSSFDHVRYAELIEDKRRARKCHCGCEKKSSHRGMANGVCLASGCQLSMMRWVREIQPNTRMVRRPKDRRGQRACAGRQDDEGNMSRARKQTTWLLLLLAAWVAGMASTGAGIAYPDDRSLSVGLVFLSGCASGAALITAIWASENEGKGE